MVVSSNSNFCKFTISNASSLVRVLNGVEVGVKVSLGAERRVVVWKDREAEE